MKKFTFLLTLLLSSIGVNAQDVFQASDAPSETTWAENTTWYKMTLKNGYVVKYDVDENNYLYAKLTEAYGENSWWCLVGNETTGYKLYNKAAGVNKVLGVSKMTEDGKARAEMCDVSDATHGTVFLFNTANSVNNVFYCKEKTSNEYINQRDNYWSNWTGKKDGVALANGEAGSAIRFYKVENQNADIQTDLTKAKEALQAAITQANTIKDENKLGYYKESVISSANTTANSTSATANDMRSALSELKLKVNQPQPGVIYRVVSAYENFKTNQGREKGIYAFRNTMKWGDVDCTNPSQYWVFETAGNGFYMKNAANHTYVSSATTLQNAKNSVVTIAWPLKEGVPVANLRTNKDKPFHAGGHHQGDGKTDNLMAYGDFGTETGGASAWNIVPATVEEIKTINANTISSVYTPTFEATKQMGTYVDADVKKLTEECKSKFVNISTLEEAKKAFEDLTTPSVCLNFDANKYYRFVNVGVSKALGTNEDKAYATTNNNSNVDLLWQVIASNGGKYNIKHANSGKYLQSVQNGKTAKTALGENESNYELRNTELGVFKLYNGSAYPAQVETNNQNTNYLNGWDGNNAKWKIYEVTSLEVAMNSVEGKSYATAYLPFGVSAIEGAEAYVGTLNSEKKALNMTQVSTVSANKGFVLVGTGNKATLTIGEVDDAITINDDLVGTNTAITLTDATRANYLVFGKNKNANTEVGFFKPSASVPSIPANKAFLNASALTQEAIAMNFGGNTTGVNTVVLGENGVNAPVFDLSGRRVVAPVKGGVYIQNGKKFIK